MPVAFKADKKRIQALVSNTPDLKECSAEADQANWIDLVKAELRKNIPVNMGGKPVKLPAYLVVLMSISDRALLDCVTSLDTDITKFCVDGRFQDAALLAEIRSAAKALLAEKW